MAAAVGAASTERRIAAQVATSRRSCAFTAPSIQGFLSYLYMANTDQTEQTRLRKWEQHPVTVIHLLFESTTASSVSTALSTIGAHDARLVDGVEKQSVHPCMYGTAVVWYLDRQSPYLPCPG